MPPLYRLLSLRYLWHRWDRAALVVASIALGVATLVSSRTLNRCLETAAARTTTPLGVGDLFVTNGEFGVLRAVADDLRKANLPGVKAVQPLVFERVTLPDLGDRAAVLVGADLTGGPQLADDLLKIDVTLLDPLDALSVALGRKVVVSRAVFDSFRRAHPAGELPPLVLRYGSQRVPYRIAGHFAYHDQSPAKALGQNVIGLELSAAVRLVNPTGPPRVNRVDVYFDKTRPAADILPAVEAVVGDRARVTTPETQGAGTKELVDGIQIGFTLCSAGAMVVGLFLVYNALAVTVAERRHDIGVMRSIGATRGQVLLLFGAAAVVLGLLGAAAGVPLGVGMAKLALHEFRDILASIFLNPDADPGWPTPWTVVVAVLAGVGTAVFAALVPAVQAASDEPADAVRRAPGGGRKLWRLVHRLTCLLLIGGGVAMILLRHDLPPRVGAFYGMLVALVGLLLSAPIIVGVCVRLTQPLFRRVLPVEARLAADNLTRAPGRTGVVIGALAAGVAVMVQTAGVGISNERPYYAWLDRMLQADQYIFGGGAVAAAGSQAPMEARIVTDLDRLPGVERATGLRFARVEYNGTLILVLAVDSARFTEALARKGTGPDDLAKYARCDGNRVVVSENFAARHGVGPGEGVTLPGPNGPVRLEVLDTVKDYSWSRGTVIMDRSAYAKRFGDSRVDLCHVFFRDGDRGRRAVTEYADREGLQPVERDVARAYISGLVDSVYALVYLQQIIVGVVAALGVVTALLISVLQRKRELGLLLAVGATPAQVVRSVLAEAVLMGAFGTLLGLLFGLPLEWYVMKVVLVEESGFVFDVLIPWRAAVGIAAGSMAVATVAGLLPALHAVRMRIPDAIAYE